MRQLTRGRPPSLFYSTLRGVKVRRKGKEKRKGGQEEKEAKEEKGGDEGDVEKLGHLQEKARRAAASSFLQ